MDVPKEDGIRSLRMWASERNFGDPESPPGKGALHAGFVKTQEVEA
jgi:hypothetical protein